MSIGDLQKALDKIEIHTNFIELHNNIENFRNLFSAFKQDYAKLEKELAEYKETCKVLSDKPLMDSIRKARKKGSKSSPYKPLEASE